MRGCKPKLKGTERSDKTCHTSMHAATMLVLLCCT
jgi:hypothetical protein